MSCFFGSDKNLEICKNEAKKEILPIIIRRTVLPFYIPVVSLICSFLLLKNRRIYSNRISIFVLSFSILILTELLIRYTGLNDYIKISYILAPFTLFASIYLLLIYKFNRETKVI